MKLNLGCSDGHVAGYTNVDIAEPADLIADLSKPYPWEDGEVEEIRAFDFIEHIEDKIHTLNECWRVLKSGGRLHICVPTTEGRGAWQDLTHKSWWNRNSFFYVTHGDAHRERFGKAYGVRARFRVIDELQESYADNVEKLTILLEAVK